MKNIVGVIGLGLTGLSLVRYYSGRGYDVSVFDERPTPPQLATLQEEFPKLDCKRVNNYEDLSEIKTEYDEFVVSPGIAPHRLPNDLPLTSELELFVGEWQQHKANNPDAYLLAVTGTNGKSTVTSLIAQLLNKEKLDAQAVGNIGVPLLDAVAKWHKSKWPQVVVAELSSYQLARIYCELGADVAVILNISSDHMDWHPNFAHYANAKRQIYSNAKTICFDQALEYPFDIPANVNQVCFNSKGKATTTGWGIENSVIVGPNKVQGPSCAKLIEKGLMPSAVVAALTVASVILPNKANKEKQLVKHLAQVTGLPHRLQLVQVKDGISYFNDSKATNVAASCQAIIGLNQPCIPIFGGQDKNQDFAELANVVTDNDVPYVVLLGGNTVLLQQALGQANIKYEQTTTMHEAVRVATKLAKKHKCKIILLSPACASQDRYVNFEERGNDFVHAVENLND